MAEKLKDQTDHLLETMFRSEPVADDGFSRRVVAKVRRIMWVRRLALPIAMLIGAAIAVKPAGQLVEVVSRMLALVPALFADEYESCFVIGYGTGVTAGELAALSSVRRVEVAEISRAVIEAAPWFEEGNLGASKSPKVAMGSMLVAKDKINLVSGIRQCLQRKGIYVVVKGSVYEKYISFFRQTDLFSTVDPH